jgi:hypothetical protein
MRTPGAPASSTSVDEGEALPHPQPPAYNSEVHSTRDMGVDELNYAYSDYQVTDTILLVGTNPMECQTNLFLNHMVKGMQNGAKVIVVDPRRTVTVDSCEQVAGAENVLHLAIASGSTWRCSTRSSPTSPIRAGWTPTSSPTRPSRATWRCRGCRASGGARLVRGRARGLQDEPCRRGSRHWPDRGADHPGRRVDRQAQG